MKKNCTFLAAGFRTEGRNAYELLCSFGSINIVRGQEKVEEAPNIFDKQGKICSVHSVPLSALLLSQRADSANYISQTHLQTASACIQPMGGSGLGLKAGGRRELWCFSLCSRLHLCSSHISSVVPAPGRQSLPGCQLHRAALVPGPWSSCSPLAPQPQEDTLSAVARL